MKARGAFIGEGTFMRRNTVCAFKPSGSYSNHM